MKITMLLLVSLFFCASIAVAAEKENECYEKYISLGNEYSDSKKFTEAVAFYVMARECASSRKEVIVSSAGMIAGELKAGNKGRSKQLLQEFISKFPKSKWGIKFRNDNFGRLSADSKLNSTKSPKKKKIYIPPCESVKQGAPQCSIGDLVVSQEWQVNQNSQDSYTKTDKIHVVRVTSKSNGKAISISCEDIINEEMWCQIASGIGDPNWEKESSLFPVKKYSFTTISKDLIGITVRSSANGGYHASQFLFDITNGKSVLVPGVYGRFSQGSIVEEGGYLYVDSDVDNSFRMANCCSLIEMTMKKRLYRINPYTLALAEVKSEPNLPPKANLLNSLLESSKSPNALNIKRTFTDIWRYHTLAKDKGWLIDLMETFKKDIVPRSDQAFEHYSNEEIIDRMIRWAK